MRLVNGQTSSEGRVEVFHGISTSTSLCDVIYHGGAHIIAGQWGTVCDDGWTTEDARVVCRQLGYQGTPIAVQSARFGEGNGTIWMDEVGCVGTENQLQVC